MMVSKRIKYLEIIYPKKLKDFYRCVYGKSFQSCLTLVTPCTVALQAPLPIGVFRQAYWSG